MDVQRQTRKPRVIIERLIFNDGTTISLEENNIVVFTGSNNSGKSQVLREIENRIIPDNGAKRIIISDCAIKFSGDIDDRAFLAV